MEDMKVIDKLIKSINEIGTFNVEKINDFKYGIKTPFNSNFNFEINLGEGQDLIDFKDLIECLKEMISVNRKFLSKLKI